MNSKIVLDAIKPKQGPDKKWKAVFMKPACLQIKLPFRN